MIRMVINGWFEHVVKARQETSPPRERASFFAGAGAPGPSFYIAWVAMGLSGSLILLFLFPYFPNTAGVLGCAFVSYLVACLLFHWSRR